jgi:glycosyltransferase involved in cell wall biosynthesis
MRILAITNLYPNPWQPNRATFNRHQFRILNEKHSVRVIAPIAWTEERKARRQSGSLLGADRRVTLDGITVDHPRYWFPPKIGRRWYGHFFEHSVKRTFQAAVREFKPDLVFAPWAYPDWWAAVRLGHAAGVPVVLQCHGSDILLVDQFPSRRKRTVDAVTGADGVVAVSHNLAQRLERLGVKADRLRVIHDGVDLDVFSPGSKEESRRKIGWQGDRPIGIFVGNLVPVKAVDVLLRAWAELNSHGAAPDLVVLGEGPLRTELEARAKRLGLGQRVTFRGSVPHAELPLWYRSADVLVLPSLSEGVPNVLLEASACGTPWIATRVGGISEIAHLGTSTLVEPNSPRALAQAIRMRLASATEAEVIPQKARETAVAELIEFLDERLHSFHAPTR